MAASSAVWSARSVNAHLTLEHRESDNGAGDVDARRSSRGKDARFCDRDEH